MFRLLSNRLVTYKCWSGIFHRLGFKKRGEEEEESVSTSQTANSSKDTRAERGRI